MTTKYKAIYLRLYPNQGQAQQLRQTCGAVRWVYNRFLYRRLQIYEKTKEIFSWFDMNTKLVEIKNLEQYSWLNDVDSQALQMALKDQQTAFTNFFKHDSGFPKFKSRKNRQSFRLPQWVKLEGNKLKLGKTGRVTVRGSYELLIGKKIKNATVSLDNGKWYVSCLIEEDKSPTHIHRYTECGIDVGVRKPLTIVYENNKEKVKTVVLGQKFSAALNIKGERRKRYQRSYSRKQNGSKNQEKARVRVANAFYRERQFRKNWVEKTSYQLATTFETIKFEDLRVKNMTRSAKGTIAEPGKNVRAKSSLNREMLRLGLANLMTRTECKSAYYGGSILYVDPRNTSRTCHECGVVDKESRKSQAEFECVHCGNKDNADRNAALNILRL